MPISSPSGGKDPARDKATRARERDRNRDNARNGGARRQTTAVQAMGIPSGKMQHAKVPTDSTLDHMGGARNTTPGQQTRYDPDKKAATMKEARRQRPNMDLIAKGLSTIAPSVVAPGISLGNMMSQLSEDEALANIDKVNPIPGDPGGFTMKKDGRFYSNRAGAPGSNLAKRDSALGARARDVEEQRKAEEERRRRIQQQAQQTALGSINELLGPGVLPI